MKSFVLAALAGLAIAAEPAKPGDACSKNEDCGDADTMCCVIANAGKFCKDADCKTTDSGTAPNAAFCDSNDTDKMQPSVIMPQTLWDGKTVVNIVYTSDNFKCMEMAKALVASATVAVTAALMM